MGKVVLLIDGPDSEQALVEIVTNAQYSKLICAIWIADNPEKANIGNSTLSYAPYLEDSPKDEIKH